MTALALPLVLRVSSPSTAIWPESVHKVLRALNFIYRNGLNLPPQASSMAIRVDTLHYVEFTFYALFAIAYLGIAAFFLIRFRRRTPVARTPLVTAPLLWTSYSFALLAVFVLFAFFAGRQYKDMYENAPKDAVKIYVTAKQWMWKFTYPDGTGSVGVLYVPVNRPIELVLTSRDVVHSFFVPAFRLKRDAVPGLTTKAWFDATVPGSYDVFCAEMCGAGHSRMPARIVVLGPDRYEMWRRGLLPEVAREAVGLPVAVRPDTETPLRVDLAELGRKAAAEHECLKCHTINGDRHIGPTWLGLYGSKVTLQSGETVVADEAYITESMMDPTAKIVAGFQPVMPSFAGQITPAETAAIIEFMKTLRDPRLVPVRPTPLLTAPAPSKAEPKPVSGATPQPQGPGR